MTDTEFREAFQAHHEILYRFAYRMTGSASAAEDIVQESFLALWRHPARYDRAQGPLRSFLLAIARNVALKRWRNEHRWETLDTDAYSIKPIDWIGREQGAVVAQAVQLLPPLQREVLVLAEYEELSLEEIARVVGVEVGTVKSRLHRAREKRQHLEKQGQVKWNH